MVLARPRAHPQRPVPDRPPLHLFARPPAPRPARTLEPQARPGEPAIRRGSGQGPARPTTTCPLVKIRCSREWRVVPCPPPPHPPAPHAFPTTERTRPAAGPTGWKKNSKGIDTRAGPRVSLAPPTGKGARTSPAFSLPSFSILRPPSAPWSQLEGKKINKPWKIIFFPAYPLDGPTTSALPPPSFWRWWWRCTTAHGGPRPRVPRHVGPRGPL